MSREIIPTNPAVQALQQEWKKAKEAEKQWQAYRLSIENQILDTMRNLGYEFPEKGTMALDAGVNLEFKKTRKWKQPCLGQFMVHHPELLQTTFKVEYKPVRNSTVDELVNAGGELAVGLMSCFEDVPAKVAFSARD